MRLLLQMVGKLVHKNCTTNACSSALHNNSGGARRASHHNDLGGIPCRILLSLLMLHTPIYYCEVYRYIQIERNGERARERVREREREMCIISALQDGMQKKNCDQNMRLTFAYDDCMTFAWCSPAHVTLWIYMISEARYLRFVMYEIIEIIMCTHVSKVMQMWIP